MPLSRITIATIFFLVACHSATDPSGVLINEVALDRTQLVPGDTMHIRVTISNPTLRTVTVQGSGSCFVVFEVLDSSGAGVFPRGRVCTSDLTTRTFGPLATVTFDFWWTGEEYVVQHGRLVPQPLPPGSYQMVGGLGAVRPQGQASNAIPFELLAALDSP